MVAVFAKSQTFDRVWKLKYWWYHWEGKWKGVFEAEFRLICKFFQDPCDHQQSLEDFPLETTMFGE